MLWWEMIIFKQKKKTVFITEFLYLWLNSKSFCFVVVFQRFFSSHSLFATAMVVFNDCWSTATFSIYFFFTFIRFTVYYHYYFDISIPNNAIHGNTVSTPERRQQRREKWERKEKNRTQNNTLHTKQANKSRNNKCERANLFWDFFFSVPFNFAFVHIGILVFNFDYVFFFRFVCVLFIFSFCNKFLFLRRARLWNSRGDGMVLSGWMAKNRKLYLFHNFVERERERKKKFSSKIEMEFSNWVFTRSQIC